MSEARDGNQDASRIERFLGTPTRDLDDWRWLWGGDHGFPVRSHRGFLGRLVVGLKRFLRPIVSRPVQDLWDRQRIFNLVLLEELRRLHHLDQRITDLDAHLRNVHNDHQGAIEAHAGILEGFDDRITEGMGDVMAHNDALFTRVDQKLDRYRREARALWSRMGALIATQEAAIDDKDEGGIAAAQALGTAQREQGYQELERRHRGSENEIADRIAAHLPTLRAAAVRGPVVDLGCGRGEALQVLADHGLKAAGVDASAAMVAQCRARGLAASQDDLFAYLDTKPEGSLGAVVSFHVIEHLPAPSLDRLARSAWRALAPGGVIVLETPSPLSLVTAASNFWTDPTHLRPVHPAHLELTLREAGFEPVHRHDLHPFPEDQRLPEIDLEVVPKEQQPLADQMNRLRDILDDLLYGHRDFALVGTKPE